MYCTFPWQLQMFITLTDVIFGIVEGEEKIKEPFFSLPQQSLFFEGQSRNVNS